MRKLIHLILFIAVTLLTTFPVMSYFNIHSFDELKLKAGIFSGNLTSSVTDSTAYGALIYFVSAILFLVVAILVVFLLSALLKRD